MKQTKFAKALALSVGVLVFSASASYLIFAWTAPSSTPPGGNIDTPINTGGTAQGKLGNLGIGIVTPRTNLDVNGAVYLTGGNVSNVPSTVGFHSSDAALLVPTYTGTQDSDLRLYLEDDWNERFSIWGTSCAGGACMNLNNSSLAHYFQANGDAWHKGYVTGQTGLCIGDDCRTTWPSGGGESYCEDGQWVTGIGADGKVVCSGSGDLIMGPCDDPLGSYRYRIFITDRTYLGTEISSVSDADTICQNAAADAGYSGTFRALLNVPDSAGSATRNPTDVLPSGQFFNGKRLDATICEWALVADSASDFFDDDGDGNYLKAPILYDQLSGSPKYNIKVWTNFMPKGDGSFDVLSLTKMIDECTQDLRNKGGYYTCVFKDRCSGPWNSPCNSFCSQADHWYGINSETGQKWSYNLYHYKVTSSGSYKTADNTCAAESRALYCVEQ